MAAVDRNTIGLKYAFEATEGTVPTTGYRQVEPNDITTFGASITTTPRNPISVNRQARKGPVTDLEASAEWTEDLTLGSFRQWVEAAVFADLDNKALRDLAVAVVDGTNDEYDVAAVSAAQAGLLLYGAATGASLLWAEGFAASANNGLKILDAAVASRATSIGVTGSLTAATGQSGKLTLAGYRVTGSFDWTWDAGAKTATLELTGLGTALNGKGLAVGQQVHIGSVDSLGDDLDNGITIGSTEVFGWCRVKSFTANTIVFDRVATMLQGSASAHTGDIDLVFGEFIRNVAVTASNYERKSASIELQSPGLDVTPSNVRGKEFEYLRGGLLNTLTVNLPITDKATMGLAFIGSDVGNPEEQKGSSGTVQNPVARAGDISPELTEPFNTTSDFARLRVIEADEDGLTTDFKSATLTIGNNVTGEKVLGTLGNKFTNLGQLSVGLAAQVIFSSGEVPKAIRENATLAAEAIIANDDGVIAFDIPSLTMGGGTREYPENAKVLINTENTAFADDDLNTSIGISIIRVPIPV